jgi:hypothetical protein
MRRAGDVVFSDVNSGTGEGVVEFSNRYVVVTVVSVVTKVVAVTLVSSATRRCDLCLIYSHRTANCSAEQTGM